MRFSYKDLIKILEAKGFKRTDVDNCYTLYVHLESGIKIPMSISKETDEAPIGLIKGIEKQLLENGIIEGSIEEESKGKIFAKTITNLFPKREVKTDSDNHTPKKKENRA